MKLIIMMAVAILILFTACAENVDPIVADISARYEEEPTTAPVSTTPAVVAPTAEEGDYFRMHFTSHDFSIEFPAYWSGKFGLRQFEVDMDFGTRRFIDVYHWVTRQEVWEEFEHEYGGTILTLGVSPQVDYTYDNAPIMAGGTIFLGEANGNTYFVNFPSGIEYIEGNESAEEFLRMIGNWEPSHWDFLSRSFVLGGPDEFGQTVLTDAQIKNLYQRAVEAYSWFNMSSMPTDGTDPVIDEDGFYYFRVAVDGINSFADLEAHLRGLFTADIVYDLLDFGHGPAMYRDFDGELFTIGASRGGNLLRGDEDHEIIRTIREGNPNMIYRVMVDELCNDLTEVIGFEIYDFGMVYTDGRWLFSNFALVR